MATDKTFITTETVALTEKKMDMSLDAVIKMSKSNTNVNKGKKQRSSANKKESFNGAAKNSSVKANRYMDSRSDVRQGAFAKRRSSFQGNQFPVTTMVARKAASGTQLRGRPYNTGRMTNTNQSRSSLLPHQLSIDQLHKEDLWQRYNAAEAKGEGRAEPSKWRRTEQWPQTLESRFANMKEERMRKRRFADQGNTAGYSGVGLQQQQRTMVPWGRRNTRFPN